MVGDHSGRNRSFLLLVVSLLDLGHFPGRLLGPRGVTVPMRDHYLGRETGTQEWPAFVLLNPDANRHTLDNLGELSGHDVPGQQRKLGAGGLVDPDDPALERLIEGIEP